jgi:TolA-binding protein
LGEAAAALEQLLANHPRDPRAASVQFTLARVEKSRGHHAKAAQLFRSYAAQGGPLAEDATAEEASAWLAAGNQNEARGAARRYLARYPAGPQAERMQRIAR